MTSIQTNISSTQALQALRGVNANLAITQNQVSSGLRVEVAADNAAYWAISTSMRSDNLAISTVTDALGLGAALVDVAYSGMSSTIDVLNEVKAKLIAAKEDGVDKAKIQSELEQLKQQALSIATSASFNGVNWLSTGESDLTFLPSIPISFPAAITRSASGGMEVGMLNLDVIDLSLFNTGGGGLLQADVRGIGGIAGLRSANGATGFGPRGRESYTFVPVTLSASDTIAFDITVDAGPHSSGTTYSVVIDKALVDSRLGTTDGLIGNRAQMADILNQAMLNAGVTGVSIGPEAGNRLVFTSLETSGSLDADIDISNLVSSLPGSAAGGLENTPFSDISGGYASLNMSDGSSFFQLHRDVAFSFDLTVMGGAPKTFTIDRAMVDAVLGTNDGIVNAGPDFAAVLNHVLSGTGITATGSGIGVDLTLDQTLVSTAGHRSQFQITNVTDNVGPTPDFDLLDIDITASGHGFDAYLDGVEAMLGKAIDAAANLGAFSRRIELQGAFTKALYCTIDKGIGRLVDADMNEASTRLRALETQQQLSVQALQIANTNPQLLLQLFSQS
jgi:flagellin